MVFCFVVCMVSFIQAFVNRAGCIMYKYTLLGQIEEHFLSSTHSIIMYISNITSCRGKLMSCVKMYHTFIKIEIFEVTWNAQYPWDCGFCVIHCSGLSHFSYRDP